MSNEKKTLADVQPGGRVRLGDQTERARFEAWHCEKFKTRWLTGAPTRDMHNGVYADNYGPAEEQVRWEAWQAALSAQPSPGGQGDSRSEKAATFLRQYLTYLRSSPRQGLRPRWCDVYEALEVAIEALAARQPVAAAVKDSLTGGGGGGGGGGQAVSNAIDMGYWGGPHIGLMLNKDWPEHSGRVYLGAPAQAVDLGELREMLVGWKNSDYPLSYEGQCAQRALDACVADLQGWLDSQAVGK